MQIKHYLIPLALAISSNVVIAKEIGWYYDAHNLKGPFPSPDALCAAVGSEVGDFNEINSISFGTASGQCKDSTGFFKNGDSCGSGKEFDSKSQSCVTTEPNKKSSNCPRGTTDLLGACNPEGNPSTVLDDGNCNNETAGNPIMIATGQKVELVNDISLPDSQLSFTRNYWSSKLEADNLGVGWQHNWQMHIEPLQDNNRIKLYRGNGRGIIYTLVEGRWESYSSDRDLITQLDNNQGWRVFTTSAETEIYNSLGQLINYSVAGYPTITFTYNSKGLLTELREEKTGRKLTLTYNSKNLITRVASGKAISVSYTYDAKSRLTRATKNAKSITYHYENTQYPNLLTGITNENGIRFATWTYDDKGLAISSEHANGTDKYTFEYLADNKTKVTNPLGKSTIFYFKDVRLGKKLTKIEGEPINSCIATNTRYSYNGNGQVVVKTNVNDYTTYYRYNDRGLEVWRRYPFIKEITTKWHDIFPLPIEISGIGRKQTFKYDDKGWLIEASYGFIDRSDTKQGQDVVLLQFDNLTDEAGNIWQSFNTPQIVQNNEAIGGSNLYLDGNAYLFTDNKAGNFDFGRDDFTIEMWIKPETSGLLLDAMYRKGEQASYSFSLSDGYLTWQGYQFAEQNLSFYRIAPNVLDGQWHHVAITRKRGVIKLFTDGKLGAEAKDNNNYLLNQGIKIAIGARPNELEDIPNSFFKGQIDQLRVTKRALYTQNFTPSRSPYVLYDGNSDAIKTN